MTFSGLWPGFQGHSISDNIAEIMWDRINDLKWPLTRVSRSQYFIQVNISKRCFCPSQGATICSYGTYVWYAYVILPYVDLITAAHMVVWKAVMFFSCDLLILFFIFHFSQPNLSCRQPISQKFGTLTRRCRNLWSPVPNWVNPLKHFEAKNWKITIGAYSLELTGLEWNRISAC